jgi:DNA-binding NtrC family response regulator
MIKNWMESRYTLGSLVARSKAMKDILPAAAAAAESDSTLLIQGDAGVGKKLLARAIHYSGARASGPIVMLSCERLSPLNVDKIFFGDTAEGTSGKLEEAADGTLVLADLEDLCPIAQERLLRVMKDGRFMTAHGDTRSFAARVISTAETIALHEALTDGTLSGELHAILCETALEMPALSERNEDIPYLVNDVLKEFAARERIEQPSVPYHYLELLMKVSWPENAQQLRNHVESVMVLSEGQFNPEILLAHFEEIESPQTIKAAVYNLLQKLAGQSESGLAAVTNQ